MRNRSPKWRIFWEWVQRRLSSVFHFTPPKYLAYFILFLAGVWLYLVWTNNAPFSIYCAVGAESAPLGTIYSTLITVLATVTALVLSLMFITVQLSASTYTPRVIRVHFYSLHFLGITSIFLGTIIFLAWRLGQAQDWGLPACRWAETSFAVFFACLLLLIPYIWISLRLLQPKHLFERLMWSIAPNDFRRAANYRPNKLDEKLQPVIDIVRHAAKEGQLRTVEEAFGAIWQHLGGMVRKSKEESLSNQIALTLSDRLFEIGRFANAQGYFETSMSTLETLKKFLEMYIIGATKRTSALLIYSSIKKLKGDFSLRYDKRKWPVEHDEIEELFSGCKRLITQVLAR